MANPKLTNECNLTDTYVTVNDVDYYDVKVFAELTNRTEQAIRLLVIKGNRLRKLKSIKVGPTILIEKSELTEYPFACAGRSKTVVMFDEHGNEIYLPM